MLEHTAPYYPLVLTDWSPQRLDRSGDVVLDHTDQLILCCGTTDWFLDAALRLLDGMREEGRRELADTAILVAGQIDGSYPPRPRGSFAPRLGIRSDRIVHVPFDSALRTPRWEVDQLRVATTNAFLDLAELVVTP